MGSTLYWLGTALAVLVVAFGLATTISVVIGTIRTSGAHSYASVASTIIGATSFIIGGTVIAAAIPWLFGLVCRHLLCTDTTQLRKSTYIHISRVAFVVLWLWLAWAAVVALSAVVNGAVAITAAMLMVFFLQLFSIICNRYIAPFLRRWAYRP